MAIFWFWAALTVFALAVGMVGCASRKAEVRGQKSEVRGQKSEVRAGAPAGRRVTVFAEVGHGPRSAWDCKNQREIQRYMIVEASTDLVRWEQISKTPSSAIIHRSNNAEFFRGVEVWE